MTKLKSLTKKSLFKSIGLVVTSLILSLLLLEGIVSVLNLAPSIFRIEPNREDSVFQASDNPLLLYTFKPNHRNTKKTREPFSRTNAHGQHDIERTIKKPPSTKRIVVLGDSVAAVSGSDSVDDTIARQLERLVKSLNFEVLNFGINGYSTRGEIELLKTKALDFSPDIVFIIFTNNDYKHHNIVPYDLNRPQIIHSLFVYSDLFRLLSIRLNLFQFDFEEFLNENAEKNRGIHPGEIARQYSNYKYQKTTKQNPENNVETALGLLRTMANKHQFRPIVAIWPSFYDDKITDQHDSHTFDGGKTLAVEKWSRQNQIPVYRLSEFFIEDFKRRPVGESPNKLYTVGDGMHPSVEGTATASKALFEILKREGHL